ncbi:Nicotinamide mononucleotide transporter [compost metagenome]
MSQSKLIFFHSLGVALILTAVSYLVSFVVGWTHPSQTNWLEILAVFTSYSCTYMCVKQSRWNYPVGILTTFIYSWFYWTAQPEPATALAVFNLYLVFSLMFGYWRWGPDGNPRQISFVERNWWLGYVGIGAVIAGLLAIAIFGFGAKISGLEIGIVVLSGVAQFLLDNKKLETWAVWIVVNILSIYFYWTVGWYLVMFQYVFFLANAFWGAYEWRKSMATSTVTYGRAQTAGV